MPDDRLIVALDVQNIIAGLELVRQLDTAVSFYKIGLGMLTSGGLALANELKGEYGKRIFLDLKLFDISATIEAAGKDLDASMIKNGDIKNLVSERASRAFEAGADGVIASPQECISIRDLPNSKNKLIVTPGIRPVGTEFGDQKRVSTPKEAILNGADHIVVGRPIVNAKNKKLAAVKILDDIRQL